VIADHVLGKGAHLLVLGFLQRLFGRLDVDLAGGVGDVRDVGVRRLGFLRESSPLTSEKSPQWLCSRYDRTSIPPTMMRRLDAGPEESFPASGSSA
jgi:hypothetical protein